MPAQFPVQIGNVQQTTSIYGVLKEELTAWLATEGEPAYRADQVLDWVYRKRAESVAQFLNIPLKLRDKLGAAFSFLPLECVRVLGSEDTTRKFLFRLHDGQLIEAVLIPASPGLYGERGDRMTLCVSSQVGCAYGCKFCASGLDGWSRHLEAGEIVAQLVAVERQAAAHVDNIVFMGMGEPLANYDNVLRAIRVLNAPWGIGIGARRITVSTSGLVPQIRRLAAEQLQLRLAISLHGASDAVREQIMPINHKYPLQELFGACREWNKNHRQKLTFEYILIEGVNDSLGEAAALAEAASELRAKVNLIPYNAVAGLEWQRPDENQQEAFLAKLLARGVQATLRREKGHDIEAACGQLRRQTMEIINQGT